MATDMDVASPDDAALQEKVKAVFTGYHGHVCLTDHQYTYLQPFVVLTLVSPRSRTSSIGYCNPRESRRVNCRVSRVRALAIEGGPPITTTGPE